ncbi:MAG: hypothetical protein CL543_02125 [Alcanivorax sp.]|nr:hypothetical protein [Alcanivorax sp.]MBM1144700.1 hypothetical protein [Alcanivorax sp. ZXX171]QJX03055.1 hypothetical protein HML84_19995 [Alcanivorax sp. IO_7]UWN51333.1 hypothetical protein ASALC70_03560 [Alcanivorax sp. ALC70]MAY09079.1 hypothetical protein [Alcanivorax sp.]|tara:strand:+ start:39931 stop:40470 length:540 start_codon:yes stop_codon:yes gene_type:complete
MNSVSKAATLLAAVSLSGCAGIVGGELARVDQTSVTVPVCDADTGPTPYYFELDAAARNDYLDDNPAGSLSGFTLGLLPTYWLSPLKAEARLYHRGERIDTYQYSARVHKFYGLLWTLPLIPVNAMVADYNQVPANEGVGLAVGWIIPEKAAARAYLDATEERGLAPDQVCYRRPDHRY